MLRCVYVTTVIEDGDAHLIAFWQEHLQHSLAAHSISEMNTVSMASNNLIPLILSSQ